MAIIVYGRKSSANVQKVIWICTEVGISFETRDIGGKYGGNKSDIFFNINPNGRIPVLDYNNFIIYESNAIIKFISETHAFLNSNNIKLNALINQWIDWGSFTFGVPCQLLTAHMAHLPIEKRDPNKVIEAKNIINEMLKILDQQLSNTNYLVGNDFTLADIPAGCWFNRCRNFEIDMSKYKGVTSWAKRLYERKAFQSSVVAAPIPPN